MTQCRYASFVVGESYRFGFEKGTCVDCNASCAKDDVILEYQGHITFEGLKCDAFLVRSEEHCPSCGVKAEQILVPCDDNPYIQLPIVKESVSR